MGFKVLVCLGICILNCSVGGNHLSWGGQFGASSSAASGASSGASSRASSSAGGSSSGAWSSSGFRRPQNMFPSQTRRRFSQRGANLGNFVMIRPINSPPRFRTQAPTPRRRTSPLVLLGNRRRMPVASSGRFNVLDITRRGGSIVAAPPGVQFVGGHNGGRQHTGRHAPSVDFFSPAIAPPSSAGSHGGVLFVDGRNVGTVPSYPNIAQSIPPGPPGPGPGPPGPPGPGATFALDAAAVGATIPGIASKLTIQGQTLTGDLILNGPGGSIIIGAEVLNGIARAGRGGMMMTEFEEMEVEPGMPPGNGSNGLKLTSTSGQSIVLHGKNTLVPPVGVHTGARAGPIVLGGLGNSVGGTSSSSSSSSSSATAQAGSVQVSASSSASANAVVSNSNAKTSASGGGGAGGGAGSGAGSGLGGGAGMASGSASAGTILVRSGTGKNERVLQLGQTDGKAQIITLSGSGSQGIQVGQGIQVPGNATVIIGG